MEGRSHNNGVIAQNPQAVQSQPTACIDLTLDDTPERPYRPVASVTYRPVESVTDFNAEPSVIDLTNLTPPNHLPIDVALRAFRLPSRARSPIQRAAINLASTQSPSRRRLPAQGRAPYQRQQRTRRGAATLLRDTVDVAGIVASVVAQATEGMAGPSLVDPDNNNDGQEVSNVDLSSIGAVRRTRKKVAATSADDAADSGCSVAASSHLCPICMDEFDVIKRDGRRIMSTICGHVFCDTCITETLKSQQKNTHCPTCRKKLAKSHVHPVFL